MKYPNPLSIKFGVELKAAIRKSGRRQNALARHLGITPPAISQMTGGRMLPPRESLEEIFAFIGLDMETVGKLRSLWSRCRLGEEQDRSQLNSRLFALRCERGLTQKQLALRTNIPQERIRTLCEDPEAEALPEEKVVLSDVLGCEPDYLSNAEYGYFAGRPVGVGEGETPAPEPVTIGLVELSICREASALEAFFHLVQKEGDRLLVHADSARLGLEPGADLYLVAALTRPSEFFSVDLVRRKDGSFQLCGGGVFRPLPKPKEIMWKLPILEVRILSGS